MSAFLRFVERTRLLLMLVAGLLVLGLLAAMSLGLLEWSDNRRFARGIALTLLVFLPTLAMVLGRRKRQRLWPWR